MKLLGSTENKITTNKNGENMPRLEMKQYQSIVILSIMIINKIHEFYKHLFQIKPLEISLKNHILLETFNSEFQEIEVQFTGQNSQKLDIEDKINLTLIIK